MVEDKTTAIQGLSKNISGDLHGKTVEHLGQLCLQSTKQNAVTMEEFLTKTQQKVAFIALALLSHT